MHNLGRKQVHYLSLIGAVVLAAGLTLTSAVSAASTVQLINPRLVLERSKGRTILPPKRTSAKTSHAIAAVFETDRPLQGKNIGKVAIGKDVGAIHRSRCGNSPCYIAYIVRKTSEDPFQLYGRYKVTFTLKNHEVQSTLLVRPLQK